MVTFVENFKNYLYSKWYCEVCTLDKLSYYREFKSSLVPEKYLSAVQINVHMKMLARLRCSSHYLRIETDRKRNIDRNERICFLCERNEIENEYHFILICPHFDSLRTNFDSPSERKLIALMTTNDKNTLQRLAAFSFHAMTL